jgi:hypothetical protein
MFITPIEAAAYEVMIDRTKRPIPIIGLMVEPVFGESFVIPMTATTAAEIGNLLLGAANQ